MNKLTYRSPNQEYYIDLFVDESGFSVRFRPVDAHREDRDEKTTVVTIECEEDEMKELEKAFDRCGVQH